MEITVTGPGRIRAANAVVVDVPDNVEGELQLIYLVPEGIVVQAGELIAQLDTTSTVQRLETELDQLETEEQSFEQLIEDQENSILDLQNSIRSAELSYELAQLQLENLQFSSELEQRQGELDLENARIRMDEAKRKLEAQKIINEAELVQRRIRLEDRQEDVEDTRRELKALTIYAPISGLVIHAEEGRWTERTKVHEGDNVRRGQDLIQLPNLYVLLVDIRINELDAERVQLGQRAYVRLEAFPRLVMEGRVSDISTLAQEISRGGNVKVFPTIITLEESDPRVRPGMTASADVVVDKMDDCLCVPLSAVGVIRQRTYVKLEGSDQPVEIVLGLRTESRAQVLEGLEEGDVVELGWHRDPSAVLGVLAGQSPVPERVAEAIIARGEDYGKAAAPVVGMEGIEQGSRGRRGGNSSGIEMPQPGAEGGGEDRFQTMDLSQMSPEMRERIEQMMREAGECNQPQQMGGGMRGAQTDSARTARFLEALRGMRDGMPDDLKAEIDRIIESGQFDFQSVSPALQDSMRARGGMGRSRRPPPEQSAPPPEEDRVLMDIPVQATE